ncbi:MAG: hypothetical protein P1U40_09430 [Coxiellaceae bacterium]|nr:hypothetical protein [Coxiellaceae bacterium]
MEELGNFDPHLLTVYERRILWFCVETHTRTQIVRRTRNYPSGSRAKILTKLKRLGLIVSFKHEGHSSKKIRRPIEYWLISDAGKHYIQQFEQWFSQLPEPSDKGE